MITNIFILIIIIPVAIVTIYWLIKAIQENNEFEAILWLVLSFCNILTISINSALILIKLFTNN
jgi:hypothetical protein